MYAAYIRFRKRRAAWQRPSRWVPRSYATYLLVGWQHSVRVTYIPWSGFFCTAAFHNSEGRGEPFFTASIHEYQMRRKEPKAPAPGSGPTHLAPVETNILHTVPNIISHCCVTQYEDGSPRQTGWIILRTQGLNWVTQVKDPDGGCSMHLTAATVDDALAMADMLLGAEDAPWQPDRYLEMLRPKKKGK